MSEKRTRTGNKRRAKKEGPHDELTPRALAYQNERISNPTKSKKQCAIDVGYSARTAHVHAYRLEANPVIKAAIAAAQKALDEKAIITAEEVLKILADVARSNIGDFVEWGPDGIVIKDSNDLTEEQRAIIAEVSESRSTNKYGENVNTKIRPLDKLGALTAIARILGMNKDSLNVTGVKALIGVDIDQI